MANFSHTINTPGNQFNEITFLVRQILKTDVHTSLPVRVKAAYPRSPGPAAGDRAGFVDAELMIDQIAPDGTRLETGTIFNLPYFRLQAGLAAIVVDPEAGDYGLAVFAERDVSRFKKTHEKNIPPSYRMHSLSDGFYFGGFSDKTPEIYIRISRDLGVVVECADKPCVVNCRSAAVTVADDASLQVGGDVAATIGGNIDAQIIGQATVTASETTVNAPTNTINGNVEVNGNIGVNGGIFVRDDSEIQGAVRMLSSMTVQGHSTQSGGAAIGGIEFGGHVHPGVQNGGGVTGGPA